MRQNKAKESTLILACFFRLALGYWSCLNSETRVPSLSLIRRRSRESIHRKIGKERSEAARPIGEGNTSVSFISYLQESPRVKE